MVEFAERFLNSPPTYWQTAPLPSFPPKSRRSTMCPPRCREIVAQAADLVPLFQHVQSFGEPPSEDELIAHFIVPFLRALGWPPERIAVKWRYIDVAVFRPCRARRRTATSLSRRSAWVRASKARCSRQRDTWRRSGFRATSSSPTVFATGCTPSDLGFEPLAYANLARLKKPATDLFARMKRP